MFGLVMAEYDWEAEFRRGSAQFPVSDVNDDIAFQMMEAEKRLGTFAGHEISEEEKA